MSCHTASSRQHVPDELSSSIYPRVDVYSPRARRPGRNDVKKEKVFTKLMVLGVDGTFNKNEKLRNNTIECGLRLFLTIIIKIFDYYAEIFSNVFKNASKYL